MCGILGITSRTPVYHNLYTGLSLLQHRGQDAFGIVTEIGVQREFGLVKQGKSLKGHIGLGHVRYPTHGSKSDETLIQPLYTLNFIFAFNGTLTNVPLPFTSDSKWLFHLLTRTNNIYENIEDVYKTCKGSYSVLLIHGNILYAFRDKCGIRPLCFGKRSKSEYCFASESVVLNVLEYDFVRDVKPGECVCINGRFIETKQFRASDYTPCLFEYIYISRPDSVLDGILVYKARQIMGQILASSIEGKPDLVVSVPETSRIAAIELARVLDVPHIEALVKNRYTSRTFIQPNQMQRENSVSLKFNVIGEFVQGKHVLVIDDSIVRGTTMKKIVSLLKRAGASKVSIGVCAPQIVNTNCYGIDLPSKTDLLVHKGAPDIAKFLGVDKIYWQDLDLLTRALSTDVVTGFETSMFTT